MLDPVKKLKVMPATCCHCLTPRKGTIIIGCLGVISSLVGALITVTAAYESRGMIIFTYHLDCQDSDSPVCISLPLLIYVMMAVGEITRNIVCIMLVVGVRKARPFMMIPYLLLHALLNIVLLFLVSFFVMMYVLYAPWLYKFGASLVGIFIITLVAHFYLVVITCYEEIKRQRLSPSDIEIEIGQVQDSTDALLPTYKTLA